MSARYQYWAESHYHLHLKGIVWLSKRLAQMEFIVQLDYILMSHVSLGMFPRLFTISALV